MTVQSSNDFWLSCLESRLSSLLPPDSPKELSFQVLNNELSGLFAARLALKQQRNVHSPVHALPPDILEEIFRIVASRPYIDASGIRRTFTGWISVTHVCRYWRQVALGRAGLWTRINCIDMDRTSEMLARSKEAPLFLTIPRWDDVNAQRTMMVLVRPHLSHVRQLTIKRMDAPDALNPLIDDMPILESLTLGHGPNLATMLSLECPDNLFSSNAPRLTHLSLVKCMLSNIPPLFTNITSFSIACVPKLAEATILRLMNDTVQSMPSLKHLSITDGYPDVEPAGEDTIPDLIAVPPSLERVQFHVVESHTRAACIFANRVLGPHFLRIELDARSIRDGSSISPFILHRLGPNSPPCILHMRVTNLSFFTLDVWTSHDAFLVGSPSAIAIRDTRPVALADFLDLFTRAHLSEVTDLRVAFNFAGLTRPQGITPRTCMQRFELASSVQRLTLLAPFTSFLQAMIDFQVPPPAYDGQRPGAGRTNFELFPVLEVLILAHGDPEGEGDAFVPGEMAVLTDGLYELLRSFLTSRRVCYGPLKELHVPHEWMRYEGVQGIATDVSEICFV